MTARFCCRNAGAGQRGVQRRGPNIPGARSAAAADSSDGGGNETPRTGGVQSSPVPSAPPLSALSLSLLHTHRARTHSRPPGRPCPHRRSPTILNTHTLYTAHTLHGECTTAFPLARVHTGGAQVGAAAAVEAARSPRHEVGRHRASMAGASVLGIVCVSVEAAACGGARIVFVRGEPAAQVASACHSSRHVTAVGPTGTPPTKQCAVQLQICAVTSRSRSPIQSFPHYNRSAPSPATRFPQPAPPWHADTRVGSLDSGVRRAPQRP